MIEDTIQRSTLCIPGNELWFWGKLDWVCLCRLAHLCSFSDLDFRSSVIWRLNLRVSRPCISHIFLLDFGRLYPSWFVDYVRTFWNMPFRHIRSVFSSAVLAFHIMVIVPLRRWRQVGEISSFFLIGFQLSHLAHCLLELIALGLPFWYFCFFFLS